MLKKRTITKEYTLRVENIHLFRVQLKYYISADHENGLSCKARQSSAAAVDSGTPGARASYGWLLHNIL